MFGLRYLKRSRRRKDWESWKLFSFILFCHIVVSLLITWHLTSAVKWSATQPKVDRFRVEFSLLVASGRTRIPPSASTCLPTSDKSLVEARYLSDLSKLCVNNWRRVNFSVNCLVLLLTCLSTESSWSSPSKEATVLYDIPTKLYQIFWFQNFANV